MADLKRRAPPTAQNVLNFMQYLEDGGSTPSPTGNPGSASGLFKASESEKDQGTNETD